MKSIFEYEHPFVTTDAVVFTIRTKEPDSYRKLPETELRLLLYQRKEKPFAGKWCLPGGFLNIDELPEDNIKRKLSDKTKVDQCYLEQLCTFCDIARDPRARIISIAYLGLMDEEQADRIKGAEWFTVRPDGSSFTIESNGKALSEEDFGFDHLSIIRTALERLQTKIQYTDLAFRLLPKEFTLTGLQNVYEAILGRKELAANFRRKINEMVEETQQYTTDKGHRPAQIYIQKQKKNKEEELQ
ncbi:MAG: NUDIX domain-containing protein [Methanomassiliicoccaceae archaeon]|nr:NUDIX domain-containing protein [Methanomassiliicoccaceae archaeon]